MSRLSVNIFQIVTAGVRRCGKSFAFDGEQLYEVVICSALDPDRA